MKLKQGSQRCQRTRIVLQSFREPELFSVLCVRHAEGGALAPVRSTDRRVARSSPTRRDDFVRCDSSGERPKNFAGPSAEQEVM